MIRRNADNTLTVKFGRQVEHFTTAHKSPYEVYEAIRWGAITAGVALTQENLEDILREVQGYAQPKQRPKCPPQHHGTLTGYQHYDCRCPRCRKARRTYDAERNNQ